MMTIVADPLPDILRPISGSKIRLAANGTAASSNCSLRLLQHAECCTRQAANSRTSTPTPTLTQTTMPTSAVAEIEVAAVAEAEADDRGLLSPHSEIQVEESWRLTDLRLGCAASAATPLLLPQPAN